MFIVEFSLAFLLQPVILRVVFSVLANHSKLEDCSGARKLAIRVVDYLVPLEREEGYLDKSRQLVDCLDQQHNNLVVDYLVPAAQVALLAEQEGFLALLPRHLLVVVLRLVPLNQVLVEGDCSVVPQPQQLVGDYSANLIPALVVAYLAHLQHLLLVDYLDRLQHHLLQLEPFLDNRQRQRVSRRLIYAVMRIFPTLSHDILQMAS